MGSQEGKKKVPIKEGIFRLTGNGNEGHLIASRCSACAECFHPTRAVCLNCYGEDLEEIALGKRGKIHTFTIARTGYPMSPVKAPFVTAQVELPEKVMVLSLITDIGLDSVRIGTEVELYFWKAEQDAEGNDVMAYAFRPVTA